MNPKVFAFNFEFNAHKEHDVLTHSDTQLQQHCTYKYIVYLVLYVCEEEMRAIYCARDTTIGYGVLCAMATMLLSRYVLATIILRKVENVCFQTKTTTKKVSLWCVVPSPKQKAWPHITSPTGTGAICISIIYACLFTDQRRRRRRRFRSDAGHRSCSVLWLCEMWCGRAVLMVEATFIGELLEFWVLGNTDWSWLLRVPVSVSWKRAVVWATVIFVPSALSACLNMYKCVLMYRE